MPTSSEGTMYTSWLLAKTTCHTIHLPGAMSRRPVIYCTKYLCNNSSIIPNVDNGGAEPNVVGEGQAGFLRTFSAAHRGLNPTIGMAFLH